MSFYMFCWIRWKFLVKKYCSVNNLCVSVIIEWLIWVGYINGHFFLSVLCIKSKYIDSIIRIIDINSSTHRSVWEQNFSASKFSSVLFPRTPSPYYQKVQYFAVYFTNSSHDFFLFFFFLPMTYFSNSGLLGGYPLSPADRSRFFIVEIDTGCGWEEFMSAVYTGAVLFWFFLQRVSFFVLQLHFHPYWRQF